MLTQTIDYIDYNDQPQSDTVYFNLTKAELTKMELSTEGGYGALLERIGKSNDNAEIIKYLDDIIKRSFGRKHEDGKQFVKSAEEYEAFLSTEAYSVFFMHLITDTEFATTFVNGIVPASLLAAVEETNVRNSNQPQRPQSPALSDPRALQQAKSATVQQNRQSIEEEFRSKDVVQGGTVLGQPQMPQPQPGYIEQEFPAAQALPGNQFEQNAREPRPQDYLEQ